MSSQGQTDQPATQRHLRYLLAVAREAGYDRAALDKRAVQEFGVEHCQLSRRQVVALIETLEEERQSPSPRW